MPDAADPKNDPHFLLHQKAADGNAKLDRGLAPHLGVPEHFEDWHWATQLNQAHAVVHAIDHYRRWWPRTAGAIVWQLNDCWPVTSWAAIDYGERLKPLWFALRASFAPRRLVFSAEQETLTISAVNDTGQAWHGRLRLRRERFDGDRLAETAVDLHVSSRSVVSTIVAPDIAEPFQPAMEILVAEFDSVTAVHLCP